LGKCGNIYLIITELQKDKLFSAKPPRYKEIKKRLKKMEKILDKADKKNQASF